MEQCARQLSVPRLPRCGGTTRRAVLDSPKQFQLRRLKLDAVSLGVNTARRRIDVAAAAAVDSGDGAGAPDPPDGQGRAPDVYEAPPELLREGLRRHTVRVYHPCPRARVWCTAAAYNSAALACTPLLTCACAPAAPPLPRVPPQISVFVADETGMINRVAGVFARRGFNIESLAVGLNIDRALFTIVVIGTDVEIAKLIKQIYKLPNVIKVDDLTYTPVVERGLMLMKVAAEPAQRREILDLATIFRASVVDVADRSMTLSVTGDPGKTSAFQRAMSKFGVVAVARTGKLALRREQAYNGQRRQLLAAAVAARQAAADAADAAAAAESSSTDVNAAADTAAAAVASASAPAASGGDVYKLEASDLTGVWDYAVLSPHWSASQASQGGSAKAAGRSAYKPHTLSLLVDNAPGVLDRVTGVIARRGYNVQSLGVGPAESPEVSRITLVVPGTDGDVAKLLRQLEKLISVRDCADITHVPFVERELLLVKVASPSASRSELVDLAAVFRAKVSDISGDTVTIEATGDCDKLAQLQELLSPYGILEVARTGRVALVRDSGVNSALLEEVADPFFA
jgi:acetolactate synthase I/III small subunit